MDLSVSPATNGERTRKPRKTPSEWKKNRRKADRYKAKCMPEYPTCNHKDGSFKCRTLSMRDIQEFHNRFYRKPDRQYQNEFVLKHVDIKNVQRRRPFQKKRQGEAKQYKTQMRSTKYCVMNRNKEKVPVCLQSFCGILGISRFRINNITKQYHEEGVLREKRGGFRRAAEFAPKKNRVMAFTENFKCVESHYCRRKSNRRYLPSELSIRKMWKLYSSEEGAIPVKQSYFRNIFNTNYNLGFGSPRTDVCSTCLSLSEKIKIEKDQQNKTKLIIDLRVHKLRAKAFYKKLQDSTEDILILSFDCQKNLPIPKLPDQLTFYSRQIYVQNFTIVKGHSKSPLDQNTVSAYVWTENQYDRDSNMIASCVYDMLTNSNLAPYKKVRLVSDGCAGQNKNSIFIGMCSFWLAAIAPDNIKEIEIVYPVTGHSFLPSDRVFGIIEKSLKKREVIATREEVYELISEHAKLKKVGTDCDVADFRSTTRNHMKDTKNFHFRISQCKRIFLKRSNKIANRVLVRGEVTYNSDQQSRCYKSLMKPQRTILDLHPDILPERKAVSEDKKRDVNHLLIKHYGNEWREIEQLGFYKTVIDTAVPTPQQAGEDVICTCEDEETHLII